MNAKLVVKALACCMKWASEMHFETQARPTHGRLEELTQRQDVGLVFVLTQWLAVPFLHWLGSEPTILYSWLVLKELSHRK